MLQDLSAIKRVGLPFRKGIIAPAASRGDDGRAGNREGCNANRPHDCIPLSPVPWRRAPRPRGHPCFKSMPIISSETLPFFVALFCVDAAWIKTARICAYDSSRQISPPPNLLFHRHNNTHSIAFTTILQRVVVRSTVVGARLVYDLCGWHRRVATAGATWCVSIAGDRGNTRFPRYPITIADGRGNTRLPTSAIAIAIQADWVVVPAIGGALFRSSSRSTRGHIHSSTLLGPDAFE